MDRIKTYYKNMPLKQALAFTVIVSIVFGSILAFGAALLTRNSYYKISSLNRNRIAVQIHDIMTVFLIVLCICSSIITGIIIFYKQKLKVPIEILMYGTEQIANENLDFTTEYYAEDELGKLCQSFENMKEELKQSYSKMWRITEERKKLNAAFSHDLRTPLTVLSGYTDFLKDYIPSPEKNDKKLLATNHMMAKYINRLEDYVETMNTIQKLEDIPIHIEAIVTNDFIDMLNDNLNMTSKEYSKTFSIDHNINLKSIKGDLSLIIRVVENIARNAFRFAKSNVDIFLFNRGQVLFIHILDDGAGFSKNDLLHALTPFYTSEQSNTSHFGIGLHISKTLCENHGGSIVISNQRIHGAKVEISFLLKK